MAETILTVAQAFRQAGGRALLVGGTVRDRILGLSIKDYDIEVFGLQLEQIKTVAERFGPVAEVGKVFGILKLQYQGHEIDIAAPRKEYKTGRGHTGFTVEIDPALTPEQAARRRDFTINAVYEDPLTGEIIDPFHGQDDLHDRVLRVVDPATFPDDPLRVLRACQFAARFDLSVEEETSQLLKSIVPRISELPKERFRTEWEKLFLRSDQPSIGLQLAMEIGVFDQYPEIQRLPETPQDPEVHPEGNVWEHTLLTTDAAARVIRYYHVPATDQLVIMLGAWLHDLGKVTTTVERDGKIQSPGHGEAGASPAQDWVRDQGFEQEIADRVAACVREHTYLYEIAEQGPEVSGGTLRRLVNRVHPASPMQLLAICEADHHGRDPKSATSYAPRTWMPSRLRRLGLLHGKVSIIRGQDLLELGLLPGPDFKKITTAAEAYAERTGANRETVLDVLRDKHDLEDILAALNV